MTDQSAPEPMTIDGFDAALAELGWKASDFGARTGLAPTTAWRWRKGSSPIPPWVGEYLRAMLALQRLHAEFLAPRRPGAGDRGPAG